MKHCKKLTLLLIAALLLAAALMTGCTGLTPAQDAPADTKKEGIYVRLERDDAYAVYLSKKPVIASQCAHWRGNPFPNRIIPALFRRFPAKRLRIPTPVTSVTGSE